MRISMITIFQDIDKFKEEIKKIGIERDIDSVLKLDLPFFEKHDKFVLISLPLYNQDNSKELIIISKKQTLVFSNNKFNDYEKKYKSILGKKYGESTVMIFLVLKNVLKNYSEQFQIIRDEMDKLDINPVIDDVEKYGRDLRRLTDKLEGLVETIIVIKEREIKEFDMVMISFDYDILNTEVRYLLERCRSHIYRISSLRTKSEMKSNKQLNDTMGRLTVIMTFLSIAGIVVSVPGTIGAIFGIPALSDAYFKPHTVLLIFALILATFLSIILGYVYWKSLGLKYHKPKRD
ncbi:MAG: CorA family divalent cation transporter [Nanoarchaeota archaeon]